MARNSVIRKRKRGRPATGTDPLLPVRFPPELKAAVEKWARANGLSRSEAIRQLVDRALNSKKARRGPDA